MAEGEIDSDWSMMVHGREMIFNFPILCIAPLALGYNIVADLGFLKIFLFYPGGFAHNSIVEFRYEGKLLAGVDP